MFTDFFKMSSLPFTERITTIKMIRDARMEQGLARLQNLLYQGSIALIYGVTGVGKSTLIKLFLATIEQNQYFPLYIHFTNLKKATSIFNLIVTGLGEAPKHTKDRLFMQINDKIKKLNLTTLLVFDDAHLLSADAITDLRLLVSSPMDDAPRIKIILSAQESIKTTLKNGLLTDFAQRISIDYHIHPLTKTETSSYIDLQMKNAGTSEKIFHEEAKEMIYEYSAGIARQINNIAIASLINASIQKTQIITSDTVTQSISELQLRV